MDTFNSLTDDAMRRFVGGSTNPDLAMAFWRWLQTADLTGHAGPQGLQGAQGSSITGPQGPPGPAGANGTNGTNGAAGDTNIKYARSLTTNASGVYTGTLPQTGLRVFVQPTTAGEFANSVVVSGTTITVTFKKFKSAGLGITLGTLLSVSAFEDSPGVVNFDILASVIV